MKKLLLLSVLMLTANVAGAANIDPCDEFLVPGKWFGVVNTTYSGPSISRTTITYSSQYSCFLMANPYYYSSSITGECRNGTLQAVAPSSVKGSISNGIITFPDFTFYKGTYLPSNPNLPGNDPCNEISGVWLGVCDSSEHLLLSIRVDNLYNSNYGQFYIAPTDASAKGMSSIIGTCRSGILKGTDTGTSSYGVKGARGTINNGMLTMSFKNVTTDGGITRSGTATYTLYKADSPKAGLDSVE